MPAENDPRGCLALHQRIEKERRTALNFARMTGSAGGGVPRSFPADPHGAYLLTNPITHVDHIVEIPPPTRGCGEAGRGAVARGAMNSSSGAKAQSGEKPRRIPLGYYDLPKYEPVVQQRAAKSSATPARRDRVAASEQSKDEFMSQVSRLEGQLADERASRVAVQAELERLQSILEGVTSKRIASST